MSDTKKYYWLKLKRDFFKRHDITVIESMPNGDKYLLFYMKLLVESIDHEGALRFSETVPYNDTMLAAITRSDIDIVRSAVKVFQQFGMMDVMDDGTLYMKQVEAMTGDETQWAEKKRLYREAKKKGQIETVEGQNRTLSDKRLEYRDKSIEIREEEESQATPPAVKEPDKEAIDSAKLIYSLHKQKDWGYSVTSSRILSWAKDIELLHRIDGRSYEDINRVIAWAKSPTCFWFPNILSGKKLREKFPTLIAQMTRPESRAPLPIDRRKDMIDF